jgi:hypothetical protein
VGEAWFPHFRIRGKLRHHNYSRHGVDLPEIEEEGKKQKKGKTSAASGRRYTHEVAIAAIKSRFLI